MNGFEVYKIYLAIKLHFTSKNQSYDYHRHAGKQQQGWAHLLKDGIDIFFTSCLELIAIMISLTILSVILFLILICGLGILLVNLVTKIINRGREG